MKKIFPLVLATWIAACSNQTDSTKKNADSTTGKKDTAVAVTAQPTNGNKTDSAKAWLIKTIEYEFVKPDQGKTTPNVYTKQYQEYKDDAEKVDMDNGMTADQFTKKWSSKYNVKNAGQGNGYLIDAQDWGKIQVTKCDLKGITADGAYMFSTMIEDVQFKTKFNRDIKVITRDGHFLIDDVIEYNDATHK